MGLIEKDCDDDCQLFRWGKCQTRRDDKKCDNKEMYDSDDLSYRRYKHL